MEEYEGPCRNAEEAVDFDRLRAMAFRFRDFKQVRVGREMVIVLVVKVSWGTTCSIERGVACN